MDARLLKLAIAFSTFTSLGATYRTPNFVVEAPTSEIAEKVGRAAEHYRGQLAKQWLGKKLPQWYRPCPIRVRVGRIGAGGATSFSFDRGEVFGWNMRVQGSLERILDSVIPHEVSHTIFACHFRRPLPRWADEGAATLIEHESEQRRQHMVLKQVWDSGRRIPLRQLLSIKEYPRDMRQVLTLYAQGYSLADFLVQAGGRTRYLRFLEDAHRMGWDRALARHYDVEGVESLEKRWSGWVLAGSPAIKSDGQEQLADNRADDHKPTAEPAVIRSQSPEPGRRAASEPSRRASAASSGSTRRGEGLSAPDPAPDRRRPVRRPPHSPHGSPHPTPDANSPHAIAVNDGWVPLPEPRLERPAPLADRIPYSKLSPSGKRMPQRNRDDNSDNSSPATVRRRSATESRSLGSGGRSGAAFIGRTGGSLSEPR